MKKRIGFPLYRFVLLHLPRSNGWRLDACFKLLDWMDWAGLEPPEIKAFDKLIESLIP